MSYFFFFFNDTATTEIYTLSLHDALPICRPRIASRSAAGRTARDSVVHARHRARVGRSEEHTSELQSREKLVCRLLLEKKKKPVFGLIDPFVERREIASLVFFFFNDTATTEIYTLSLHDALPISDTVLVS